MLDLLKTLCFAVLIISIFSSCEENAKTSKDLPDKKLLEASFTKTMQKHLDAVSNKDLESLASTMDPSGNMQLIMPGQEVLYTADSFLLFHEKWFQDTNWTFTTNILNSKVGDHLGVATTEILYEEPERDGKPYFNRMIVTYVLEHINNRWYIVKDHASSIEKSTDKK